MKKLFALLVIAFCMLLTGCDEEIEFELTETDITANHTTGTLSRRTAETAVCTKTAPRCGTTTTPTA